MTTGGTADRYSRSAIFGASWLNTARPRMQIAAPSPSGASTRASAHGRGEARGAGVDDPVASLLEDRGDRVEQDQTSQVDRVHPLDSEEDERAVEQDLGRQAPYLPDVAKAYVERGEQHGHAAGEQDQHADEQRDAEPAQGGSNAVDEQEGEQREQIQPEVERRRQHDGEREDQPWEVHLAHQRLPGEHAGHRVAGGLLEELHEHDVHQQQQRVVADASSEPKRAAEDDEQHGEGQQRTYE